MRPAIKKGMSLQDMYPAILTLVLVGIVLGAGLFVLDSFHNTIQTSYTGTQGNINASTGTTTLTDAALTNFNLTSISSVINQSSATFTNYTFTSAGVITWGADISGSTISVYNVTYTYTYDAAGMPETAVTSVLTGLDDFASWIAIIVVVLAAAVVLGLVLSSFGRRRAQI